MELVVRNQASLECIKMVNIILADDNRTIRKGLKVLLGSEPDFEVVAEAENGLQALEIVNLLKPDVLVLDLMMPGLSGLEVIRSLVKDTPQTLIVVLSMHANEAYVSEALRCGAKAYILKESPPEELLKAIRSILHNICYLSPPLSDAAIEKYQGMAGNGSINA